MAPIRVGIIGLSTTSDGTNWAALAHLPYLQSTSKYEIVALCNSSVEKAEASIAKYNLPAATKAYGCPKDLAKDGDVDLVVCVVGVERHYELLKPVVEAGKNVFTELPLAQNIDQMRELESVARDQGIRTVFGMQGQANPAVNVIKQTIDEGKIGKVLSSTVVAYGGRHGGTPSPKGLAGIFKRETGGDMMTVWFLHSINFVLHVLGELASFDSMLATIHSKVPLINPADPDQTVVDVVDATSPDQVSIHGRLDSGAFLSYRLEGGEPFPGEPGLKWHIVGEKGEILVTNPIALIDIMHGGAKIVLKKTGSEGVSEVEIPSNTELDKLRHPAQNVGRLYEAFADNKTEAYSDWTLALRRHELINEIYQQWDGETPYGAKAEYMGRMQRFLATNSN